MTASANGGGSGTDASSYENSTAAMDTEIEVEPMSSASSSASRSPFANGIKAPSFDTTVFSDFVANVQEKTEQLTENIEQIDSTQVLESTKENALGLVDNALAGDWLNRGELYGAVQLALVVLLLRSPGVLDALVGFAVGPLTLLAGAAISAKSMWDLGRKQISIWPAPVPDAELRTGGMYSVIRHPVYAGLLLASVGFAVSTASPARLAVTAAMAAFLVKKIDVEEQFLRDTYPEWSDYEKEVPAKLIPKIW